MNEALLVSNLVLWALVVILAAVVVALTRQVGLLHARIAPVGALATSSRCWTGTVSPCGSAGKIPTAGAP